MAAALAHRGLSSEHAGFVVDGLLTASLRGIDTHGIRLFPVYLAELDGGRARARPEIRWQLGAPAFQVMDAGHALGLVAGQIACREAVRLAKANGIAAVAVKSSNHFGAASVYSLQMARAGVIGLAFTNSDALVAPAGGVAPLFGTNPLSAAALGAGGDLFCVDMATSQVSYSKVKSHRERGLPLEPGWAVTPDGRDAAEGAGDAAEPAEASPAGDLDVAALKPLGGHKGQCLGMLVEVLTALLTGMPFDHELSHLYAEPYDEPRQVAHLFLAIDVAAGEDPEVFRSRLSRLLNLTRAQEAGAGERVVAPGDLEQEAERERLARGIPLTAGEAAFFERIEAEAGTS
jgi:LDH2 family malate/lactate/ureidoglycolate dehydrogenase